MAQNVKVQAFRKYSPDYNENSIRKAQELYGLTDKEAGLIRAFMDSKKGENLSESRKRILYSKISGMRQYLKAEYQNATIQDLLDYCDTISKIDTVTKKSIYTPHTVNEAKSIMKEFYYWMIDQKLTAITANELKGIKKKKNIKSKITGSSLLTSADITAMLNATSNPMHKALIALLAESGARIHEVAAISWSQLKFDQNGAVFSLWSEKTQSYRYVRLRDAVPYLSAWKSLYQNYRDDAPVFVTAQGNTLIYETCRATIARIAKKAGIKKKVNPHLFRHSRVTELLKLGMHEPELKKSIWGDVSTKMLAQYEHLAGGNIDAEYCRIYGIDTAEKKPETMLSSIQCTNCHTINRQGAKFCTICGLPLTEESRKQVQTDEERLFEQFKLFMAAKKTV